MAVNGRREPLGRLSLQPANRQSLAGPVPPLKPSAENRQSIANRRESTTGRPAAPAFSRLSLGGNASRQSIAPAASRQSLGGNSVQNPANRRLSSAPTMLKSSDPRNVGQQNKAYTQLCAKAIFDYLETHGFESSFSIKNLTNPSTKDFKAVFTFLMREIDQGFDFGPTVEDEFRSIMKHFGYPVSIGKSCLTPVGSPHTWPIVLAAMHWLVEYLMYEEELKRVRREPVIEILGDEESPADMQQLFEHNVKAYLRFMKGDDEVSSCMDEEVARIHREKNQRAAENLKKAEAKLEAAKAEKLKLKSPDAEIKKFEQERDFLNAETEKFKKFVVAQNEHKTQQAANLDTMRADLEEQHKILASFTNEKKDLESTVARQEFTAEQVAEMNHRRAMLKESLDYLHNQKKNVQEETFNAEKQIKTRRAALEPLIKAFNSSALNLELAPLSARNARGIDFTLKLSSDKRDVNNLVGVDLTKTIKPALAKLHKQLSDEVSSGQATLRDLGTRLGTLREMRTEQARRARVLEERAAKKEEEYRDAKDGCEEEINGSADKIEDMERQVNLMKVAQSRILEESETRIHNLDNELIQQRQMQMAAMEQVLQQINIMSERVIEHKNGTQQLLASVVDSVKQQKELMNRPAVRTPGRPARPGKA